MTAEDGATSPATGRFANTALKLPSGPVRPQSAEPIDLLALAGPSVAARALPAAAVATVAGIAASPRASVRWLLALVAAVLVVVLGRQSQYAARARR